MEPQGFSAGATLAGAKRPFSFTVSFFWAERLRHFFANFRGCKVDAGPPQNRIIFRCISRCPKKWYFREKKREKRARAKGQAEAAPRACKDHKVIQRPKAAGFIAAPRCWAFDVRVRV
jgi:hypothetical protein